MSEKLERRTMEFDDYVAEGERLFGPLKKKWRFVCPRCGTVQSGEDFQAAGKEIDFILKVLGFSCIGRYVEGVGCDWTLGGLFQIHTLEVILPNGKHQPIFEFDKP